MKVRKIHTWTDNNAHYFIFFTQISQYFSIREAPSTSNKASWVATLPQSTQNLVLSLFSVKGLNDVNLLSTWFSSRHSHQLSQYYPPLRLDMSPIYTLAWCNVPCVIFLRKLILLRQLEAEEWKEGYIQVQKEWYLSCWQKSTAYKKFMKSLLSLQSWYDWYGLIETRTIWQD